MFKLPFAAILAASFLVASMVEAKDTVVDYYHELQMFPGLGLEYPLVQKNGQWVSKNIFWDTDIPAVVDIAAGYIFFSDEGTGGGNFDTQIVLWRKPDGAPLIGIAEVSYDAPYPMLDRLRFYEKFGSQWQDVTGFMLPELGIASFMPTEMTIADLETLRDIGTNITVSLPRVGTSIQVYLVIKETYTDAVCSGAGWFSPYDPTPYYRYCKTLEGRMFTQITLDWNKSEERFILGSRTIAPALAWSK